MSTAVFEKIAVIGAGLLGTSIALAADARGAAGAIRLYDTDERVRDRARKLGFAGMVDTAEAAVSGADCVILCVPVGALGQAAEAVSSFMKPQAILTDVGSVKAAARDAMRVNSEEGVHIIPGHPIAGTERSGPEAGFSTLFEGAWMILTPHESDDQTYLDNVNLLSRFWEELGSTVEIMDAERHDRVLAITSHLPHLIAYNIVSTAYDMESVDEGEVVKYSAGGFRDFTRIAASDPTMWRDVFLNNKDAVLETLGRFSEDLAALQRAIRHGDGEKLFAEFERARGIRKAILEAGQDSDAVNFGRNEAED